MLILDAHWTEKCASSTKRHGGRSKLEKCVNALLIQVDDVENFLSFWNYDEVAKLVLAEIRTLL